jgi:hypothetical protein
MTGAGEPFACSGEERSLGVVKYFAITSDRCRSCSEVPMRRLLIAGLLAASLSLGFGAAATAAPVDCPPGQFAEKTDDFWTCANNGGNSGEAGDSRNPNGNPNFRR